MSRLLLIVALCASLALVACGGDDGEEAEDATGAAPAAEAQADEAAPAADEGKQESEGGAGESGSKDGDDREPKGTEISTGDSQFGQILFGAGDRAIYYFDKESGPTSECYGECASAWPPVLTDGEPQAVGGARAKLLGTTERDDGSLQVTYDGRPLYYYVDDPPGEVLCHNVAEFGGLWLAVEPNGDAVPS